jgi:hypothetical protein
MSGERHAQAARIGANGAALLALALALGGCSTTSLSSLTGNIFGSSQKTDQPAAPGIAGLVDSDVECPDVKIRNGAATLLIGSKPQEQEPAAMDVRYQGSILRTARECHVSAGMMTMKVGIEGRVITGPAGGPGIVDVPMRVAIVQEGVNPVTITSKFAREQVTVNGAIDRVTFTHIEPDIVFPLPQPVGKIDSYVVYVGFDALGAPKPAKKKPASKHKAKPVAKKPRPNIQPNQS